MKASGREIKTNTEMRGANGGGGGGGGRREGDPERQSEREVGERWPARCGARREMGRLRRDGLGAQRPAGAQGEEGRAGGRDGARRGGGVGKPEIRETEGGGGGKGLGRVGGEGWEETPGCGETRKEGQKNGKEMGGDREGEKDVCRDT